MSTGGASAQVWLIASFDLNASSCSDSALVVLYCDLFGAPTLCPRRLSPCSVILCFLGHVPVLFSVCLVCFTFSCACLTTLFEGKRRSQLFPIPSPSSVNVVRVSRCSLLHSRCHGELLSYFCGALFSCDALSATQEVVNNQ